MRTQVFIKWGLLANRQDVTNVNSKKCFCFLEYDSDYDLTFTTSEIKTFSRRSLYQDLHAFTVAFWIRTADETNAGTPLSYSVKLGNYLQENALVLKDYGNLGVQINNQTGITGGELNDGKWHHVAITWRSTDGIWVFYRDGKEASRAEDPIAKGLDLTDIFLTVNSVFFAVGITCTRNRFNRNKK